MPAAKTVQATKLTVRSSTTSGRLYRVYSLRRRPPSLTNASLFDYVPHALRFRRLGREQMLEVLRVGAMSAQDWVGEYATDPLLQSALCAPACFSAWVGPRSPLGTANLLFEESLCGRETDGGGSALIETLNMAIANSANITVHSSTTVTEIIVADNGVRAVRTQAGTEHEVSAVIATCAPQHAMLELVNARHLNIDLARNVEHIRSRGSVAVAHFGIQGELVFSGAPEVRVTRAVIGETTTEWEKCFDDVKHRRLCPLPCLDVRVVSRDTAGLCPKDHHVVSVHAFGAPHNLDGGWTDDAKTQFLENIVASMERYVPNFGQQIIASRLLSPADLERDYDLPGGHLLHAEIAVDQLWVTRPTPALARYTSPIQGLYLGSMGMHPGAGINGLSGLLAARACLAG